MTTLIAVGQHTALLLVLVLIYNRVISHVRITSPRYTQLATSFLFGLMAVAALLTALDLAPDAVIDGHPIVIVIATVSGGWLAGVIAVGITIFTQLLIGHAHLGNQIGLTMTALVIALLIQHRLNPLIRWHEDKLSLLTGLLIGLATALWIVPVFPEESAHPLAAVLVSVLLLFPAALFLSSRLLSGQAPHLAAQPLPQEDYLLNAARELWHTYFLVKDIEGRYVLVNKTWLNFVGESKAESAIGKTVFDYFPAEVAQRITDDDRQIIETQQPRINFEQQIVSPVTGQIEWRLATKAPIIDAAGQCTGIVLMSVDITERKQAEAALRQSEQNYRTLLEQAADGIMLADAQGHNLDANPRALEILGYTLEEFLQISIDDVVAPEDRAAIPIDWEGMRTGVVTRERQLIHKDGHRVTVEVSATTLADGRHQGIIRDVSERRKTDSHLKRLEQATTQAADGIAIIDADGNFEFVNQAWAEMHGYEVPDLIGQSMVVCHSDQQVIHDLLTLLGDANQSDVYSGEAEHIRKDGSQFPASTTITLLRDASNRPVGFIETADDISARKEQERARQEQYVFDDALRDATSILLASTFNLSDVLEHILVQIARVIDYDTASVMMIDGEEAHIVHSRGFEESTAAIIKSLRFPLTEEAEDLRVMIETCQPIIIADTTIVPYWKVLEQTRWIRSYVGAPIQHDDHVIGFINLDSAKHSSFNTVDAQRLKDFADRAALAIENVRLYDNIRKRSAELESLRQASISLASRIDVRLVLDTVLEGALKIFAGVENAYIYLYQDDQLKLGMVHWRDGSKNMVIYEPRPNGMHYTVARTGQPIVVNNISEHPLFADAPADWRGATMTVPLKAVDHVVGVLRVYYPTPRVITEHDVNLLQQLGDQAAAAIENARLFQQLQQSEERFRQLAESVNEVFWLYEPDMSRVVYVNPAYEMVWGQALQTVYQDGYRVADTTYPDDREHFKAYMRAIIKNPEHMHEIEFRIVHGSGQIRSILARTFPVRDDRNRVVRLASITEDITERKEAQEKLIELSVQNERVRMLRDFISYASHDLKTPLQIIFNKLHLLRLAISDDDAAPHFDVIDNQVRRLEHIINNLLMLSRLDEEVGLEQLPVDLNRVVYNVTEGLEGIAAEKVITLDVSMPNNRLNLVGDEDQLTRALTNLVENAVQYTLRGGRVSVTLQEAQSSATITVQDTGVGIEPNDLPHIFERFFRADKARATNTGGSGLGLAIVKKIIEMHAGNIQVQSQSGEGSTFTISLPLSSHDADGETTSYRSATQ